MKLLVIVPFVIFFSESGNSQNCTLSVFPSDPKSGCCGHAVGGEKKSGSIADIDEYPWMGIVEYRKGYRPAFLCGAVLVSGRYVLSGATCFSEHALKVATPINIRLGEYDTNNDGPDCIETPLGSKVCNDGAMSIPIEKYTNHPDYNKNNSRQHDIALIRLAKTVPYSDYIRPICLPSSDITVKAPKNLYMIVAGWGAINRTVSTSNVLRRIHVPHVDFYLCKHKYTMWRTTLTNGQLCAGSKNRDSCHGDSGGPLMFTKGQITELIGIVSFGPSPCGQDTPSVYTRVFAYKDWIQTTMEADERMSTTTTNTTATEDFNSDLIIFRE